ncbi:MAG: hypothetical protein ABSG69_09020 [Candidatus Acidiferrum sp.]|jgi:hypothetical protein
MPALFSTFMSAGSFLDAPVFRYARMSWLIAIFVFGPKTIYSPFREEHFRFRGGEPMPTRWGRIWSLFAGLLMLSIAVYFWNR